MSKTSIPNIPTAPLLLGFAGLIPFMFPPIWVIISGPTGILSLEAVILQQTYAAIILSFMGAVHWGLEIADHKSADPEQRKIPDYNVLVSSVCPALFAWFCLQMNSSTMSLLALAACFLVLLFYDFSRSRESAKKNGNIPLWYTKLRLMLTTGAVASLVLMAFL